MLTYGMPDYMFVSSYYYMTTCVLILLYMRRAGKEFIVAYGFMPSKAALTLTYAHVCSRMLTYAHVC